jgi:CRP-like cAMP-binding protein
MRVENPAVKMLSTVPMFQTMKVRQIRGLVSASKERDFPAGHFIVNRGDMGLGFYLILDGEVQVRRGSRTLATLGAGQFFGEMSLIDKQPRSADVVSTKPTKCLVLSQWEFWGYVADTPEVLRGVLQEMARRLRQTNQALSE